MKSSDKRLTSRLPDVRPYLYFVGFVAGDRTELDMVNLAANEVEDYFVKAGRNFLMRERDQGNG